MNPTTDEKVNDAYEQFKSGLFNFEDFYQAIWNIREDIRKEELSKLGAFSPSYK